MSHHDPHALPGGGRSDDLDAAALDYLAGCREATAVERRRRRDEFIRFCLPFARSLSFDYRDCGEPLEDLDQTRPTSPASWDCPRCRCPGCWRRP